jgi:hypothetical protein
MAAFPAANNVYVNDPRELPDLKKKAARGRAACNIGEGLTVSGG